MCNPLIWQWVIYWTHAWQTLTWLALELCFSRPRRPSSISPGCYAAPVGCHGDSDAEQTPARGSLATSAGHCQPSTTTAMWTYKLTSTLVPSADQSAVVMTTQYNHSRVDIQAHKLTSAICWSAYSSNDDTVQSQPCGHTSHSIHLLNAVYNWESISVTADLFSSRPYGLELSPGFYQGPGNQYRLFQTCSQNVFVHLTLVHHAQHGFLDDNALYKFTYLTYLLTSDGDEMIDEIRKFQFLLKAIDV